MIRIEIKVIKISKSIKINIKSNTIKKVKLIHGEIRMPIISTDWMLHCLSIESKSIGGSLCNEWLPGMLWMNWRLWLARSITSQRLLSCKLVQLTIRTMESKQSMNRVRARLNPLIIFYKHLHSIFYRNESFLNEYKNHSSRWIPLLPLMVARIGNPLIVVHFPSDLCVKVVNVKGHQPASNYPFYPSLDQRWTWCTKC